MHLEPTVFVVDDDPAVRDAMTLLLTVLGYGVESYASARQFLQNYDPSRPGCLLLDIYMPGMDGLELQKVLGERGIRLPVIILTGHGDRVLARQAMARGAVAFLEKPVSSPILVEQIEKAMKSAGAPKPPP